MTLHPLTVAGWASKLADDRREAARMIRWAAGPDQATHVCDLCGTPITPDNFAAVDEDGHLFCVRCERLS